MKKIIIIIIAVLLAGIIIPVPKTYADGTKSYSALAYKIVKWNRPFYKNLMFTQTEVYKFPHSLKSVDELWDGMEIDPAVSIMTGTAEITDDGRILIRITEDTGSFKAGDTADITDYTEFEVKDGDILRVEYLPELYSKGPMISEIVDIKRVSEAGTGKKATETEAGNENEETDPETGEENPASTSMPSTSGFVTNPYKGNAEGSVHYIRMTLPYRDGENLPCAILIKSESEWKSFRAEIYSSYISKNSDSEFNALNSKYGKEFFAKKSLAVVMTQEGSGSRFYTDVTVSPDGKEIKLTRIVPEVGTCDMAYWCVIDELERSNPVFSQKSGDIKVSFENAKSTGQLPGMIMSDVHVGRADGNTMHGLKSGDAEAVKKIIGRYTFDTPGYDNISDVIIRIEDREYYYDSESGIVTVNGNGVNSDKASKLTDSERIKLNSIIRNYIDTGKPEPSSQAGSASKGKSDAGGAEMSFECKDGKTGVLTIRRSSNSENTDVEMMTGRPYKLEAKDGLGWTSYESYVRKNYDASYRAPNPVFTMEARSIPPGGEYTETISFINTYGELKPGRYRISKTVTIGTGSETGSETLYAEFTVQE